MLKALWGVKMTLFNFDNFIIDFVSSSFADFSCNSFAKSDSLAKARQLSSKYTTLQGKNCSVSQSQISWVDSKISKSVGAAIQVPLYSSFSCAKGSQ